MQSKGQSTNPASAELPGWLWSSRFAMETETESAGGRRDKKERKRSMKGKDVRCWERCDATRAAKTSKKLISQCLGSKGMVPEARHGRAQKKLVATSCSTKLQWSRRGAPEMGFIDLRWALVRFCWPRVLPTAEKTPLIRPEGHCEAATGESFSGAREPLTLAPSAIIPHYSFGY